MSYGFYSSIVAALRAQHRGAGGLCRDAANEIERLRKALEAIANINVTPKTAVSVAMAMRRISKEALSLHVRSEEKP